jgi:hypothetical protein
MKSVKHVHEFVKKYVLVDTGSNVHVTNSRIGLSNVKRKWTSVNTFHGNREQEIEFGNKTYHSIVNGQKIKTILEEVYLNEHLPFDIWSPERLKKDKIKVLYANLGPESSKNGVWITREHKIPLELFGMHKDQKHVGIHLNMYCETEIQSTQMHCLSVFAGTCNQVLSKGQILHSRFPHPGKQATRDLLNVKGVNFGFEISDNDRKNILKITTMRTANHAM